MSDTKHWITKLVPALAFAAGIIISSVGGIITTSSAMKLAFFEESPHSYINEESCRYDYTRASSIDESIKLDNQVAAERTSKEVAICIEKKKQEERTRFKNSEKQDIVDGVSSLVVGGILLLVFRRRK